MKKYLQVFLALVLTFTLAACGNTANEETEAATEAATEATGETTEATEASETDDKVEGEDYTIGFIVSTQTNPYFVTLKEGIEAKAEELGVEVVTVDAQDDPAQAASGVEDLITRKVDLILVNPTDSDAIVPSVEAANAAGIPVMTVDRTANGGEVISHIASDNVAGGVLAGEFIVEKIGEAGKVVELEGIPGANSTTERGEGFAKAIEGTDIEVVARQTANYDRTEGLNVMENLLQSNPEIDAVFAQNDEMALGALEAIQSSGREILVVGFDATDDAVASVEEGKLAATVAQKPKLMGETALEIAVKYLKGEKVEAQVPVELELVTK